MRKFAILTIITVLIFISIEFILRALNIDFITAIRMVYLGGDWREHQIFTDYDFIPDPYLFWRLNPKNKLLNSKGFIAPEFSITKPKNTFRIFCLGDSNTMGIKDSSYPVELRNLLHIDSVSNTEFEVINAGVSGYTSLQGLRLCSEIMRYQPDLITVCFGWNDTVLTRRQPDKNFKPGNKFLLNLQRLFYKTNIYRSLRYIYFKYKYQIHPNQISYVVNYRVNLEDYKKNLIDIAALVTKNKAKILFITRPYIVGVERKKWVEGFVARVKIYNSATKELALKLNVDLIDAEELFALHPEYFVDTCHLNDSGNEVLAKAIYNYVMYEFSEDLDLNYKGEYTIVEREVNTVDLIKREER